MRRLLPIIVLAVLVAVIGLTQYGPFVKKQAPLEGRLLKVHFIDVGQGDSILVQTPDGRNVLVDAGDEGSGDTVVRYLLSKGVHRIDLLVITHPHSDHIGGLPRVLDEFGVSRILDAGYPHGSRTYRDVLSIIESRKIDYKVIQDFRNPEVGTMVGFDVLWPPPDYRVGRESELNNGSIVLRLSYDTVSVLLTGDIQGETEGRLLADRQDLRSTILKVAHHGSEYSTSNEFLQVVKPDFAVISVGRGNDYGHPAKDTLERLAAAGAQVFRTDENGTVVFTSDGTNVQVSTER
jgi:competence protein ComEC